MKEVVIMKVVCFGEVMLRLNPPGYERFAQTSSLVYNIGGAEANVAVSTSNYGIESSFVTRLPAHEIGTSVINMLRRYGVDTSQIIRGGSRVGIYYLEKGASQRSSKVIYDRANSAIAQASASDFNWECIFEGADWFHFTGITPALSDGAALCCLEACRAAKSAGIKISCDLNYRKNLWSPEKAGQVMGELMKYVDLCIANEEDADMVFGIKAENTDVDRGIVSHDAYRSVAAQLAERFGCEKIAITLRTSISANDNDWAGMLYDSKTDEYYFSPTYNIHIVDRVGGGDSFGGGLIYALLSDKDNTYAINFAVAASALKHTIEGDFNLVSIAEVESLMSGSGSGRVQR